MSETKNFIHQRIDEDLKSGKYGERVHTRFPPEPNGYLHIGHAKAIWINFSTAEIYGGKTNLRFDDTNPVKEDMEFVNSIQEDIKWMGFQWDDVYHAADYFDKMYDYAVILIKKGKAYVDDLTAEEMKEYRGTLTEAGKESPYRNRSVEENLELFEAMKNGEFEDGSRVLRAKIDMASPNMNMRDPAIYRIKRAHHHRTGDKWCIYPMYDYAHPIEDAIEGITHSLCSLEFEDHRPFYDWVLEEIGVWQAPPVQIEFAKLNISNTIMGKRYIRQLVEENVLKGWDDPRLVTLSGLRRRGYTPDALKKFIAAAGVSKSNSIVDIAMMEHFIRDDLKLKAERKMAVLDPIKLVITNYPEGEVEYLEAGLNPENPEMGSRKIPFGREIYIDREDFMENPPKKYYRLFPGNEVRLRHAYFVKCNEVIKDAEGNVTEIHCTYDPETKSGSGFTGRKVKGTIHWVYAPKAVEAKVSLYDHLVLHKDPEDFSSETYMNENSLVEKTAYLEESFKDAKAGESYQFLRHGYFIVDAKDSTEEKPAFNRIVSLKSSFKLKK